MQAASLGNSPFQPRAESQSFPGSTSGASFKTAFESVFREQQRPEVEAPHREMLPQDERTIRSPQERTSDLRDERDVEPVEGVEAAEKPREADVQAEQNEDEQEAPAASEHKPQDAEAKDPKEDHSESAEEAAALAAAAANIQATPEEQTSAETPADGEAEAVDATATGVNALQATLQNGQANQEVSELGQPAVAVGAKLASAQSGGDPSLDDAVAQMESVPDSEQTELKSLQATEQGEGGEEGSAQLEQSAVKLADAEKPAEPKTGVSSFDRELSATGNNLQAAAKQDASQAVKPQPMQNLTPEQKFVQDNVDQVVTSVRTQSLSGGGQMNVRLDPPELGALQVAVKMIEGRLTASFTTSNEQATQLLSHSLQHLKSSLEASGVNVDRIEVRQAPQNESSNSKSNGDSQQGSQHQRGFDAHSQQSEQQRKEMVRRMWRKLAFGSDDLDLVA